MAAVVPAPPPLVPVPTVDRIRRVGKPSVSGRRSKKGRQHSQLATKDLGRWKPTDDLALIIGVQQVSVKINNFFKNFQAIKNLNLKVLQVYFVCFKYALIGC